ncbi:DUF3488 and transglutaminase-like domain-containing protein [Arthrobacter sp. I2-34]|uniref:DUF3488 and transglutaminase-like domain-containing protein n=1 Tax=Arthrobacter hankyongi TaxID=2904801 RepID=A0ABS9L1L0_9MICC|nr:DUF3488 and transglutaminase-like domain-containing protein [Arthrobacter hankyongi]MCG2620577.1 DUF3488 and transglutaminase-like domain-containing protein [Arthrobacter hankyongi]
MLERPPEAGAAVPGQQLPRRRRPDARAWLMGGALALAVCLAAASLHGVLEGWDWLPSIMTAVLAVELGTTLGRVLRWPGLAGFLLGLAGLVAATTAMFLAPASLFGFIPGPGFTRALQPLLAQAEDTVVSQVAPVLVNPGIVLAACVGIGLAALLLDTIAVPLQMPAAAGAILLAVATVPAVIKPGSIGPWGFAAAAAGFLLVLGCTQWYLAEPASPGASGAAAPGPGRKQRPGPGRFGRGAVIGTASVLTALVLPLAVPGFNDGLFPEGSRLNWLGLPTGLNPIVSLGDNLRRPGAVGRMTYATDAGTGLYLRSVTLEKLSGARWRPSDTRGRERPVVEDIPLPQLRTLLAQGTVTTTEISTASYTSPWLLAPYAPARIEGLAGTWTWDPRTLSIRGEAGTTTADQDYTVTSVAPRLTRSLLASIEPYDGRPEVDPAFSELPADMPQIIRDTTAEVVGDLDRPFEQAMAIQRYLRGPGFVYSEQAPVDGGYDQSGFGVVGAFLQAKAGYCVHFSAAMAIMAREAGIPSRIAVGYAPGRKTGHTVVRDGVELDQYEVDSRDAHAWPELYFDNVGWVAFEPTPGRGVVPDYAQASNSGRAPGQAPEDTLDPGRGAPARGETTQAVPEAAPQARPAPEQPVWAVAMAAVVLLALLSPLLARTARLRRRRARLLDPGTPAQQSALLAWREVLDAAADYGQPAGDAESAREFEARLGRSGALAGTGPAALGRLRTRYERAAYAGPGAQLQPPAAGTALLAEVEQVRAGLHAAAGWRQRLTARLLPRSLARSRPEA